MQVHVVWVYLFYLLQLFLLLLTHARVSAKLKQYDLEQDMCGRKVLEGETKRYAMNANVKLVAKWEQIVLPIFAGVTLILFIWSAAKGPVDQQTFAFIGIGIVLLHIGAVIYLATLKYSDTKYKKDIGVISGFLKRLVERKNDATFKKGIPLGFEELYNRIVDRITKHYKLSSRKDVEQKIRRMSGMKLAYFYAPTEDGDFKLILPEFNCRLLYSQCTQGRLPRCLKNDNTVCQDTNAASSISYFYDYDPQNTNTANLQASMETNLRKIIELYNSIISLRDTTSADPTKAVKRRFVLLRVYIYMMLLLVGFGVFHQLYANVDAISISLVTFAALFIIIYVGANLR